MSAPGLVTELVAFVAGQAHSFCKEGRCGMRETLREVGSDEVGAILDEVERCERARELLIRATPEAVRQADAAPEMYEALKEVDDFLEARFGNVTGSDWGDEDAAGVAGKVAEARATAEGKP